MTQTAMEAIGQLRTVMEGPVIAPGDPGFDDGALGVERRDRPASRGDRPVRFGR